MSSKRFAVIGAGAGGLCAAKNLLARGIVPVLFEIGSRIGGLWVYENDSGRSPAYKSLRINSEARVSSYIDFPFPDGTQYYPGTPEMEAYFASYARTFDLIDRIRFNSRVEAIVPQGAGEELDGGAGGTNDVLQRADVPRRPAGCARAHVAERCAQRGPRGRQHAHEERERSGVPSADARMQHQ